MLAVEVTQGKIARKDSNRAVRIIDIYLRNDTERAAGRKRY